MRARRSPSIVSVVIRVLSDRRGETAPGWTAHRQSEERAEHAALVAVDLVLELRDEGIVDALDHSSLVAHT
jgi:hypothetical protein